jgi:hypothetical protein
VKKIGMNKSARKEPVVLPVICYSRRIKNKIVQDLLVAEGDNRYNGSDNNNNQSD